MFVCCIADSAPFSRALNFVIAAADDEDDDDDADSVDNATPGYRMMN